MSNHAQPKWTTIIALSVIVASIIALVMLVPQIVSTIFTSPDPATTAYLTAASPVDGATPSPALTRARAVLVRVRAEIIPRDGLATDYGVTFSDAGYQALIKWNEEFKVEPRYANAFESLDLLLPCCDWRKPSRNEEQNCACGHHQALEGLSKRLLSEGRSRDAVQREITLWTRFMFPAEALGAEMERRAQFDPDIKAALAELKARGEC